MRSGLLRGFGGIGDADSRWTVGQRDQLMIDDDFFNLLQAILIKRQNRIAYDLFLLQFADYIAVVARRQIALLSRSARRWVSSPPASR